MSKDKSRIWNSCEIEDFYASQGGTTLSVRCILNNRLLNHFGDDLLMLNGNGVESIFMFRSKAPQLLKLVSKNNDNEYDLKLIAKTIKKECSESSADKDTYKSRLYVEDVIEKCCDTLLNFLAELSPKLDHTNIALMMGNMITSVLTNQSTPLQITLGTTLREKLLIEQFSEFGVTCTYDKVKRFKKSVAHAASNDRQLQGLMDGKFGLVQTVADNFDANIASPNGLKSIHSLALLVTQVQESVNDAKVSQSVRRLRKEENGDLAQAVDIQYYKGPQKPSMPDTFARHSVLPDQVRDAQVISMNRAQEVDYSFLCRMIGDSSTPECNGFNTEMVRFQGQLLNLQPKQYIHPSLI